MKYLLMIVLLTSCAGMKPAPKEMLSYEQVFKVENKSQNELYEICNRWMVDTFHSADAVIQYQEIETGSISGKYVDEFEYLFVEIEFRSIIDISVKDNKVRLQFRDARLIEDSKSAIKSIDAIKLVRERWLILAKQLEEHLKTAKKDW